METRAIHDIVADRLGTFYDTFAFIGQDFTGGTFKMQVRLIKDSTGTPYIDLGTVSSFIQGVRLLYSGSATVSAHIAAGRLTTEIYSVTNPATGNNFVAGDTVLLSQLGVRIDFATLRDNVPYPSGGPDGELGDDVELFYDLTVSSSSIPQGVFLAGKFTVRAGVTR